MSLSRLMPIALCCMVMPAFAQSTNKADYPLRIHIFAKDPLAAYRGQVEESLSGNGRANLFEKGMPHAVDYTYACTDKVRPTQGADTYPAKWKTPGHDLIVLMPATNKEGAFFPCTFHTQMKTFAYISTNGVIGKESAADFKAWMVKHQYDPEHDKDAVDMERATPPPAKKGTAPAKNSSKPGPLRN
jgi:hypothetical protein